MKTIAVINLGPIGDVINSGPVCNELREKYPEAKIIFITVERSFGVARCLPGVDEVFVYDKNFKHKGTLNLLKFSLALRFKYKIDLALILNETLRSALFAFLIGAKKRVGRISEMRGLLLTHKIPFLQEEIDFKVHASEMYMRVLKPIGLYNPDYKFGFNFSEEDEAYINKVLTESGYSEHNLIGLCPCSTNEFRDWDPEEAAGFINYINQSSDKKVVIVGVETAGRFAQKIREAGVTDFLDLSCKTTLPQLGALISKLGFFVSVDTAPMHLAFALRIPTLALFFQDNIGKWGSKYYDINKVILSDEIKAEKVISEYESMDKSIIPC